MVNIASALKYLYPTLIPDLDYIVSADSQGNQTLTWDIVRLGPRPTDQQISDTAIISVPNDIINRQIIALEAQQTPDALRAAILGKDNGFLANLDTQISGLKSQITVNKNPIVITPVQG